VFKLKPSNKILEEKLKLANTSHYDYLLTTNKDFVEGDKVNIVFQEIQVHKITKLLDFVVNGEEVFLLGLTERGQKRVELRSI